MTCKNCNLELETNSRFCSLCGNKVITKRITIKNIIAEFNQQFLNYDNKLLKTFRHLIIKPELVIDAYITGNRKKYVNVITYLAVSLSLIGFQLLILRKVYPEKMANSATSSGLNPELEKRIAEVGEYLFDYFGLITIVFIPITALSTYIIFRNRRHNYAEHIILNMYTTAQFTILLFLISTLLMLTGLVATSTFTTASVFVYIYLGYCYIRLYGLSIPGAIWRTIVSQILYMIFVGIIFFTLTVIGVFIYKLIK